MPDISFPDLGLKKDIVAKIWHGNDPFSGFPFNPARVDIQGWSGSRHPWLEETVRDTKPRIIVEIGVWKGASAIHMAEVLRALKSPAVIICIDTWLGAEDHWADSKWLGSLQMDKGYPTIFQTFMNNVVSKGLQDYIVPLPLDSVNAATLLRRRGIAADLIHIDAGHEYQAIANDISAWWPALAHGGVLIGDDYYADGKTWPGVKAAFDDFVAANRLDAEVATPKIRIRKPVGWSDAPARAAATMAVAGPGPTAGPTAGPAAGAGQAGTVGPLAQLPEVLEYRGEFGAELVLFLPFCAWLSKAGLLKGRKIKTYKGMGCFYDDLECDGVIEKTGSRHPLPPEKRPVWLPVKDEHQFDRKGQSPFHLYPDLRAGFGRQALKVAFDSRPLLIIHNKHNIEWAEGVFNFIPLDTLDALFRLYKKAFNVVYIRHGMKGLDPSFSHDMSADAHFDDAALLARHPEVHGFDELYASHIAAGGEPDLNRFKNILYSRCHRFMTVQGGGAHHIAMFSGAVLIVLHQRGREVEWAYGPGYYGFMAQPAPVRLICRDPDELLLASTVLVGSEQAGGRILLGADKAALLKRFHPG